MASATISNSAGPGSSIQLAPKTIQVRDAVIERCEDQTLEQMNEFVKSLLANETDELKRLGVLAARVFILRQRIMSLSSESQIVDARSLLDSTVNAMPAKDAKADDAANEPAGDDDWTRLRILKACEVNGVRFQDGVIVDVRAEDAKSLISSGKAEKHKKAEAAPISQRAEIDSPTAKAVAKPVAEAKTEIDAKADPVADPVADADTLSSPPEAIAPEVDAAPAFGEADDPSFGDLDEGDSSDSGMSDEERADAAMEAIFAAAEIQEAELAEIAAAEAAAAEAAAKAEREASGIIDDTVPEEPEEPEAPEAPEVPAAAEATEATKDEDVDATDLEELAAFAGLTGGPTSDGDGDGDKK